MNATLEKQWTASRVREELPELRIIGRDNKNYLGRLIGRHKPEAAIVVCDENGEHVIDSITGNFIQVEFAWATIAEVLNSGKPITFRL